MSRYELKAKPSSGAIKAVVGWDRPLQTFFAQVFTATVDEPDEGEATIWQGTEPGELATPEAAIVLVANHAEIPGDLAERLAADMRSAIGVKDGAHQARAKLSLFGRPH